MNSTIKYILLLASVAALSAGASASAGCGASLLDAAPARIQDVSLVVARLCGQPSAPCDAAEAALADAIHAVVTAQSSHDHKDEAAAVAAVSHAVSVASHLHP